MALTVRAVKFSNLIMEGKQTHLLNRLILPWQAVCFHDQPFCQQPVLPIQFDLNEILSEHMLAVGIWVAGPIGTRNLSKSKSK